MRLITYICTNAYPKILLDLVWHSCFKDGGCVLSDRGEGTEKDKTGRGERIQLIG
jgi:hypothetical protein